MAIIKQIILIILVFAALILGSELILRFFPVKEPMLRLPVNDHNPIMRFAPNRSIRWSKDWNFSIVNDISINNYGFVSDIDFESQSDLPLIAVIGDSMVEAVAIPWEDSVTGRLHTALKGKGRAYGFGVSGAGLSQNLAVARFVEQEFKPDKLIFIIIPNDFGPNLRTNHSYKGYHYFVPNEKGELSLSRVDYDPHWSIKLMSNSSLVMYLHTHINVLDRWKVFKSRISKKMKPKQKVKQVNPSPNLEYLDQSKKAILQFLDDLPKYSNLNPSQIHIVLDGLRPQLYDAELLDISKDEFAASMRRYMRQMANERGYRILDMQEYFINHYRENGRKFELPQDGHWNSLGNKVVTESLLSSGLVDNLVISH